MWFKSSVLKTCLVASLLPLSVAHAEIIIHGTRAIYPAEAREISLQLSNNGDSPSLVQVWIDEGDRKSTPDASKAPFMINPPISRVDGQKSQTLRITRLPNAQQLSKTQETLYWLNVLDIPPKPTAQEGEAENFLQLAVRSRIKFFYRPQGLKIKASEAPSKIVWQVAGSQLKLKNPTPYHITLTSILQDQVGQKVDLLPEGLMLLPFSEQHVSLKGSNVKNMIFTTINDYGGRVESDIKFNESR